MWREVFLILLNSKCESYVINTWMQKTQKNFLPSAAKLRGKKYGRLKDTRGDKFFLVVQSKLWSSWITV